MTIRTVLLSILLFLVGFFCAFNALGFPGCTDPLACNFNPFATVNDLSCVYPAEGEECSTDCIHPVNGDDQCYFNELPNYTTCGNPVFLTDATFGTGIAECTEIGVYVTADVPGATVQPGDLHAVFVALEHECAYDLHMELISPDGTTVLFCDLPNLPCPDFGLPANDTPANPAGLPGAYFWSMTGTNPDTVVWPVTSYPSGAFMSANDLDAFVGSPIDGVWTIRFCDQIWAYDGYVFHAQPVIANSTAEWVDLNACTAGCSNPIACNYSPGGLTYESNCLLPGDTCDDGDPLTLFDSLNSQCECAGVVVEGCPIPGACNYDPIATVPVPCIFNNDPCDDGDPDTFDDVIVNCECQGEPLPNCTDPNACNYNPLASNDDGSCTYPASPNVDCDGNCILYPHPTISECLFLGPHDYACTVPIAIPDNQSDCLVLTKEITAVSFSTLITLNPQTWPRVFLNIEHEWVGDLDVTLTSPDGGVMVLYNGVPQDSGVLGEPSAAISDGIPGVGYDYLFSPLPGSLPEWGDYNFGVSIDSGVYGIVSGNALNNDPIYGTWTLTICDTEALYEGFLWDWQIAIPGSESTTFTPVNCNGCTDFMACNYDPLMTINDGSCEYLPTFEISGSDLGVVGVPATYTYPSTEGSTYQWAAQGGQITSGQATTEVTVQWIVDGERNICIQETDATGCTSLLNCKPIQVAMDVTEVHSRASMRVYPNPTSTALTVAIPTSSNYLATLHDASGRRVREWQLNGTTVISTADLATGVYTLIVGDWRERIVIVR
ncbi:MAG: proprotein convertase P-domain-containing protein [Flavobacteriales bacterium]